MQKKTETTSLPTEKKPTKEERPSVIAIDDLEWVTGGEGESAMLQSGHDAQRMS